MGGTVPKSFPSPGAVGVSQGATVLNPAQRPQRLGGPAPAAMSSAFYGEPQAAAASAGGGGAVTSDPALRNDPGAQMRNVVNGTGSAFDKYRDLLSLGGY